MKVRMYVVPDCPDCVKVKAELVKRDIEFEIINLRKNYEMFLGDCKLRNIDCTKIKTAPVIFIRDNDMIYFGEYCLTAIKEGELDE